MHEQSVPHFTGDAEPIRFTISLSQAVGVAGPPPPAILDLFVEYVRLFFDVYRWSNIIIDILQHLTRVVLSSLQPSYRFADSDTSISGKKMTSDQA